MADIVRCQNKLASFRIRELKDVLARLGLPKQGKKQILMDKIMGLLRPTEKQPLSKGKGSKKHVVTREEAINIIDEAYRCFLAALMWVCEGLSFIIIGRLLRNSGAEMVVGGKQKSAKSGSSSGPSAGPEETPAVDENKTRCPCGNSAEIGTMIQCDDPRCRVWQHMNCVVVPEKPTDGLKPDVPPNFFCELCRISRGDPFCLALAHPLIPTMLNSSTPQADGSNTLQTMEKSFTLSPAHQDLLQKPNHDLQVWCALLSDKVSFRMHWPSYADLHINGASVRVTNRPGQQLLGANGRDEGPPLTGYTREGLNRLSISAYDARTFCIGVRIIQRRSLQQVLDMVPSEKEGELFEEAMQRVRRCIGGGQGLGIDDDDGDSDLEVVAESITVNLRCPMSGSRIKVAGRFKPCLHMGCFDLDTFVELNQRSRKWQCPICLKNYSIETLVIDPFFNRITNAVKFFSEDITEVELKADGSWRPKLEGEARYREPWRLPGSAEIPLVSQQKPVVQKPLPVPVKLEEGLSEGKGPLRLGMKRTADGLWAMNGSNHMNGGPSQKKKKTLHDFSKSTSGTDTNIAGEDEQSVNQDPSEKIIEFLEDNDEVTFPAKPIVVTTGVWQSGGGGGGDPVDGADVIVLSDTDDENGEDLVVRSSGGSVHGGSDTRDSSRARSPEESPPTDGHEDSSSLAVVPGAENLIQGSSSKGLPFNPLVSTQMVIDMTEKGTSNSSGLGLQVESNNFWSVPSDSAPKGHFGYYDALGDPAAGRHLQPVRPTPMQAVAGSGFLPSPLSREDSRPSGWIKYRQSLPPVTYVNSDSLSNDNGRTSSPTERQFMLPDPVRTEVPSNSRDSLVVEENIDNSWFSLRLGGGESTIDAVPTRSLSTSSHERPAASTQPASRGSSLLTPNSNGTTHLRPSNTRVHSRGHIPGSGFIVPSRPRSSPHVRRPHYHFRVDDSDTE